MQQNLSDDESHTTKLSESKKKRESCDSTNCEDECYCSMSVRNTPNTKRGNDHTICEDALETNLVTPMSSVVHLNVQDCNTKKKDLLAHGGMRNDRRIEKTPSRMTSFAPKD